MKVMRQMCRGVSREEDGKERRGIGDLGEGGEAQEGKWERGMGEREGAWRESEKEKGGKQEGRRQVWVGVERWLRGRWEV